MRTTEEIEAFQARSAFRTMAKCPRCAGASLSCECRQRHAFECRFFDACIPETFLRFDAARVTSNRDIYDELVVPYMRAIHTAWREGVGIFLHGENGTGKTLFLSMILSHVLRGPLTAYYTTLPQLSQDMSTGWRDPEFMQRLELMLSSDFVAFDELGKESYAQKDNPTRVLFERIVKQRFDRGQPSLFASNAGPEAIALDPSMGGYGETVWSVISGSCKDAVMDPGDFRKQHLAARAKAKIWRDG